MLISPAYAQGVPGAGGDMLGMLTLIAPMLVIFYFLILRPQQQRTKQHREMIAKVRRGDTVVTSGGFVGKVMRVADNSDEVEVELSDTMRVRVLRSTLIDVRSKNEPVKETT